MGTPNIEEKKKEDKEKVATAVLSITAKQKKKNAEKGKKDGEEKMDVDKEKKEVDEKKDEEKKEGEEKKKEAEPLFEMLANPVRVMKAQLKVVTLEDARYRPMKDLSIGGIVMLNRTGKGDQDEEIVEPMEVNKASTGSEEEGDEPAPPEPFEWREEED